MLEYWIERGIGEIRAVLVEDGQIVEARVRLDGTTPAGSILDAVLARNGRPAVASCAGEEFLLPCGSSSITQGARLVIEVTREAIPGAEPWKRPLARIADGPPREEPLPSGRTLALPAPTDALEQAGWLDLIEEARSGVVRFAEGELRVSPTPAMTLIDVDGRLAPAELARAGAEAAARTIRRHGIGGSIGIDLPTIAGKTQRQAVSEIVDAILPQPFERTAMNGFGFLQIVRPRRHASLFELALDRAPFEARALLRRAAFGRPGARRIVAHPAVTRVLESRPEWLEALSRQAGGEIILRADPAIAMSAGHAEPA